MQLIPQLSTQPLPALCLLCRDIKLENLFISSRGHLQLGDFGLAISVLEERAISPVGTLEYMAPEILRLPSTGAWRIVCMAGQQNAGVRGQGQGQATSLEAAEGSESNIQG